MFAKLGSTKQNSMVAAVVSDDVTRSSAPSDGEYRISSIDLGSTEPSSPHTFHEPDISRRNDGHLESDPEWLAINFHSASILRMLLIFRGGDFVGRFPVVIQENEPLICRLGEFNLAKLPVKRLKIVDTEPDIPADASLYDEIFSYLVRTFAFDIISIAALRTDSALCRYINENLFIRSRFIVSQLGAPTERQLISVTERFDDYLGHWSAKTRKNRLREIKILESNHQVALVTITEAGQVDGFLAAAESISKKTYQYNLLGTGIRASPTLARKLRWMAHKRILRSYLLECDSTPIAFIFGYQYGNRYTYKEIGYDPGWAEFNVGNVLLLKSLENTFSTWRPKYYDLGGYLKYKEMFSTYTYPEAYFVLFRKRPYAATVSRIFLACIIASRGIGSLLERWRVKARVKKAVRRMLVTIGS